MNYQKLFRHLLILLGFCSAVNSQIFFKSYDFPPPPYITTEVGKSIELVTPGLLRNWTVVGYTRAVNMNDTNQGSWFIKKLAPNGNVLCVTRLTTTIQGINIRHDSCFSHIRQSNQPVFMLAGSYARPAPFPFGLRQKAAWSMVDTSCNHLITRMISDSLWHQYRGVTKDNSDNFVNAGYIETFFPIFPVPFPGRQPDKILASKYSPAGFLLWANRYMLPSNGRRISNDIAYSVCYQPVDNTYGITGTTDYFTGKGGNDIFIMKVDQFGVPLWFRVYKQSLSSNSQVTESRRIIPMPDGGFSITGWTNVTDPTASDILILTVNSAGGITWFFTYGNNAQHESGHAIIYNSTDSFFTFTGSMTNPISSTPNTYWAKIKLLSGGATWFKYYNNPDVNSDDVGFDLEETSGSVPGYVFTGKLFRTGANPIERDVYFAKTDIIGRVSGDCPVSDMLQKPAIDFTEEKLDVNTVGLQDENITPYTDNPVVTPSIVCMNGSKDSEKSTGSAEDYSLAQNYPNPFNPVTSISFNLPDAQYVSLKIYNILGAVVATLINSEFRLKGNYSVTFDAGNLSSGVYFYEIKAGNYLERKKMLLIK